VTFLRNLEHSVGLSIYDTSLSDEMAVALISKKIGLDFDDALQYFVAKKLGVEAIASFDEHFDKLDVRRVEPRELLPVPKKRAHLQQCRSPTKHTLPKQNHTCANPHTPATKRPLFRMPRQPQWGRVSPRRSMRVGFQMSSRCCLCVLGGSLS
jgi:hypothetical protein